MTIASHVEGRLRVRDPRLRRPGLLDSLRERLLLRSDVREVSCNPKVGSLLVLYRKGRNALQEISAFLTALLDRPPLPLRALPAPAVQAPKPSRQGLGRRRAVNFGMLGSLLASLIAAAGSKELHILAGVIFLGTLAIHVFERRRALFA